VIITAAVIGSLAIIGLRWEAIATFLVAFAAGTLNLIVKTVVARPRPSADLVHVFLTLQDFSFPSGHVMFYTAFYGFLMFLSFTLLKRSWTRYLINTVLILLVGLVGISRMYLGEHWASDVLGGYLLGSLVLIFGIILYRWGKDRYLVRQPVAQGSTQAPVPHEEKQEIKEALKNPMMVDKEQVKKEVKKEENKEVIHDENHSDRPTS
jgi:undecaprenyl-diphosphatase